MYFTKQRKININFKLKRMRENAFVEAWKTQHRRVSMILGLTLLCAPSAISVYAENGVNDITVQAVMQTKTVKGTVLENR